MSSFAAYQEQLYFCEIINISVNDINVWAPFKYYITMHAYWKLSTSIPMWFQLTEPHLKQCRTKYLLTLVTIILNKPPLHIPIL